MAGGSLDFDSLEESDVSDLGSDYEFTIKAAKRKKKAIPKPPPKRPRRKTALRVTSSPGPGPIPVPPDPPLRRQQHPRGTSRQAFPEPVTRAANQPISAEDMYNAVRSGKSSMVAVVDEWLDDYKRSREAGLLVLINFIVQSCGCKGVVSREMLDNMENAEIISTLTRNFNEDSTNYPLCTAEPQHRRFKAGLCEFAQVLVQSCRNSLVYDEYLFPSLLSLLTGLTDSQVRAFRHTSTLLAMKLMTGLVKVAVTVSVQLKTTQRRHNIENSKREPDRACDRLEELQATIRELQENSEELNSLMNGVFRGVFVHRYRDRLPEIRVACMVELGVWLKTDPEDFLSDGYLKYLGWTLHDKQSPVRLVCVHALQGLYQEKEFIGRLELFTIRFKERMLNMVMDKDPDVAVEMVNLLLLIQQTDEALEEQECAHVYPLVYASHRGLASAAGAFLYHKLKSVISSANQENGKSDNAAFLQILISFYIQSESHEHGAYLVDSLWGVAGAELRDWGTMTTLLLQEDGLQDMEEGALIELMICALRQAAQVTPPVGRAQGKKFLSMKDRKMQEPFRRRITTHFIPLLPQLLAKYSADAVKVTLLLKAPLYFDLEMYNTSLAQEKHLDLLLSQICGIVEKHTELSVLEACAHLANTLCSDKYTFSTRSHLAFSQLLDGLTERFSMYVDDLLQGSADDDDTYSAATALKRIAALSSAKDITGWKLFDSCLQLLKSRIETRELDKELMVSALKCAAFHLMWAKVNVVNSAPTQGELHRLMKEVRSFCRVSQTCLSVNQPEIRSHAFELLCDLMVLYNMRSVRSYPDLQTLIFLPPDSLRSELAAFLLDHIFTDPEDEFNGEDEEEKKKITLLLRKRNQLAGYCKLILYGVLDLSAATDVFKHYTKYFKDFGDIIKETISKTKLINPVQSARTVCLTLQQLFSEMLTEEISRRDIGEIRDLAKRLAMSFGIDLHRIRKPLELLHTDGIRFALREPQEGEEQHPNVAFMEILSEFSSKLLQQDRAQLAAFLTSMCPRAALSWPPVRMYRRSLEGRSVSRPSEQEGGGDATSLTDLQATPTAKRKRTTAKDSASSVSKVSRLDSSSLHSSMSTPAFTSTVLRQTTKQLDSARPGSVESDTGLTESDDEFSSGIQMRKVKPIKRRQSSILQDSDHQDLDSHLTLLSLIEDEIEEREEDEIEKYESASEDESAYALPSTRNSASVLDELFN